MTTRFKTAVCVLFFGILGIFPDGAQAEKSKTPRNIILMIGDGMGLAHITATGITHGKLNMERFKTAGFAKTFSADSRVTDSAAAATAMATGHKTGNRMISMLPDGRILKTVLEEAEERGNSTGLAVLCSITDATPAAFAAHAANRGDSGTIAANIAESGVDVLIGGGRRLFLAEQTGLNLMEKLEKNMTVVNSLEELHKAGEAERVVLFTADGNPPSFSSRGYALADLATGAISILSRNRRGFFLMIEGSQIDWAGHTNDTSLVVGEVKDFDDAVGAVLDYAGKDGQTLVVVAADRETGGMSVISTNSAPGDMVGAFSSTGHTAVMVPVFAYGPGSEKFGGIIDNTDIGAALMEFVKSSPVTDE